MRRAETSSKNTKKLVTWKIMMKANLIIIFFYFSIHSQ